MRNSRRLGAALLLALQQTETQSSHVHIKLHQSHLRQSSEQANQSTQSVSGWSQVEGNLTSSTETLDVSSAPLGEIAFVDTHEQLQTLTCSNASLTLLSANRTYLETLDASNNLFSSFEDIELPSTIVTLDLSGNQLMDWKNFELPRDLQSLNVSHNAIDDVSNSNLTLATDLVSIDLSSNNLTVIVGLIFPRNLTTLYARFQEDLSNNSIETFEVRESDLALLSNLFSFKMDDLEQSSCPTSGATTETVGNVQICVVSDTVFQTAYFRTKSAWQADESIVYLSVTVSALISVWFVVLLVGHAIKGRRKSVQKGEEQRDTMELSTLTASRHWSQSKEEGLPNDVRFDEEFTSFRIDPSDVMQVRTLAHGNFAMTSLVYLGDKQAVMKKVSVLNQGQDRDQMVAFMDEIRVCAKLDHPKVVGFLGIMWAGPLDLSAIVEYVPKGNLAVFLREKKSSRKTFTWMKSSSESPSKLSLALQISEALVYLQSFAPPVIYGHLKADSMLLGSAWEIKLNRLGYKLDTSSLSVEDRAWIAPEVLASGEFDEKSDIFSFGVVLSELDRCKLPLSHRASRRLSIEDGTPFKPKFREDCPPDILEIALKCLQDDPVDRPSAMELYYSFRQLQRQSQC